jgi:hypothetical protein
MCYMVTHRSCSRVQRRYNRTVVIVAQIGIGVVIYLVLLLWIECRHGSRKMRRPWLWSESCILIGWSAHRPEEYKADDSSARDPTEAEQAELAVPGRIGLGRRDWGYCWAGALRRKGDFGGYRRIVPKRYEDEQEVPCLWEVE